MKNFKIYGVFFAVVFLLASCASTSVARLDTDSTVDLSGNWNDADIRMVTQNIVDKCLSDIWLKEAGDRPIVQVGSFRNLSSERIDAGLIVKNIESALIRSRLVRFVADMDASQALQEQKMAQQTGTTNAATAVKSANATGAAYSLSGTVKTVLDTEGNQSVKFYQIDANIVNLETNEILWADNAQIKKLVKRATVKF